MRLWHLKVFNEIMASGTISQAAKNLKRTQSSISAALSNLEKGIGYQLFIRKKRRLHAVPEAYFLKEVVFKELLPAPFFQKLGSAI